VVVSIIVFFRRNDWCAQVDDGYTNDCHLSDRTEALARATGKDRSLSLNEHSLAE